MVEGKGLFSIKDGLLRTALLEFLVIMPGPTGSGYGEFDLVMEGTNMLPAFFFCMTRFVALLACAAC